MPAGQIPPTAPAPQPLQRRVLGWLSLGNLLHGAIAIFIGINLLLVTADCLNSIDQSWGGFNFNYFFTVSQPRPELALAGQQPDLLPNSYGVRAGDVLIRVNGQPPRLFDTAITQNPVGDRTRVTYVLARQSGAVERQITVSAPVFIFGWAEFFTLYGISLITGWMMYLVGVLIYLLKPNDRPSQLFMLAMAVTGADIVVGFDGVFSYRVNPLHFAWFGMFNAVLLAMIGAVAFQLATQFPAAKQFFLRQPAWQYIFYPPAIVLAAIYAYQTQVKLTDAVEREEYATPIPIEQWVFLFAGICLLTLIGGLIWDALRSRERLVQRQARVVLGGVLVGVGPILIFNILPRALFGRELVSYVFGNAFLVLVPLVLGYAIIRYRLFTLNFLLRRSLAYFSATLLVIGIYFAAITLLQLVLVGGLGNNSGQFAVVFSTLLTAILFNPIRLRLQGVVERYFFRERFVFRQAMLDFGDDLRDISDLGQLSQRLVAGVTRIMGLRGAALYLYERNERGGHLRLLVVSEPAGQPHVGFRDEAGEEQPFSRNLAPQLPLDNELQEWLVAYRTPFEVDDVPGYLPIKRLAMLTSVLNKASVVAPLVASGRLVGLLVLGERRGGVAVGREERELLGVLLPQAALAVRNAQLLIEAADEERIATELELARQIQRGLFPTSLPQPPGLQVAAFCQPAKETSGDFYDVVETPQHLTFVVADACGKSVPAAMTMGLARNTVRSEIGHGSDPATALTRANRWLVDDMGGNRYVALTCLRVELGTCQLTLANAGGLSPILYHGGQSSFVASPGLTVPLGITEDVQYQQTTFALSSGDRLLLYTDGIVEAINANGQMFSFEQLQATVASYTGDSSEGLVRYVLDAVTEFCGGSEAMDDMTIMAILPDGKA